MFSEVMADGSTTSLAIVAATDMDKNAPTKLSRAARPIATFGEAAPVEIEVATTLAVSWNPLVKSNARAVATTMTRRTSPLIRASLGVLDDDAFEDESDPLGGVDRILEQLEDVLPANHDHGVDPVLEQRGDRAAHDLVALILEPVDLHGVLADVLVVADQRDRRLDVAGRVEQYMGERLGLQHRGLDAMQAEVVRDL